MACRVFVLRLLDLSQEYMSCHNRKCGTDNLSSDINLMDLKNKLGKFLRWDGAKMKHRMFVDVSGIIHWDDVLP
jgi:hypothetical protein